MKTLWRNDGRLKQSARTLGVVAVSLLLAAPAFGQTGTSPWENAVSVLQQAFTSTIARGLSLVAIVVAGVSLSFSCSPLLSFVSRLQGRGCGRCLLYEHTLVRAYERTRPTK